MKKFFKKLFCKHNRVWEFYPEYVYFNKKPVEGLKIIICMDCKKIIKIEDYCE